MSRLSPLSQNSARARAGALCCPQCTHPIYSQQQVNKHELWVGERCSSSESCIFTYRETESGNLAKASCKLIKFKSEYESSQSGACSFVTVKAEAVTFPRGSHLFYSHSMLKGEEGRPQAWTEVQEGMLGKRLELGLWEAVLSYHTGPQVPCECHTKESEVLGRKGICQKQQERWESRVA